MILFTNHSDFIPIIKQLKEYNIVTFSAQFAKTLNNLDIGAKSLADFITPEMNSDSKDLAAITLLNFFQYEYATELGGIRGEWLINKMPGYLYNRLDDMALILITLDKLMPELVVVHNDIEPMNRMICLWAELRGVPALHIPHSVYLENGGVSKIGTDVHDLITASYAVCNGPFQMKWFIDRGMNKDNLFLTGLLQFDKLAEHKFSKRDARSVLGLNQANPVITYMSSWRQDTNLLGCHDGVEESYENFLKAVKELEGYQYIIKCHPNANTLEWHKEKAKEYGVKCIVLKDHLDPVLSASDLVISYGASNVVLEAATYNNIKIAVIGDELAFPSDDEIYKIKDGEIAESIKMLLSVKKVDYTKFLKKYFFGIDGNAHLRIAALIDKICKLSKSTTVN